MTYDTALAHYKTGLKIAQVLGIKSQAVYQWKKTGVVPELRARQLQQLSRGRVKVDPQVYERGNGRANAGH
jgi:hypothetical protein